MAGLYDSLIYSPRWITIARKDVVVVLSDLRAQPRSGKLRPDERSTAADEARLYLPDLPHPHGIRSRQPEDENRRPTARSFERPGRGVTLRRPAPVF